jgi:predicted HAD superfamily Cof-like phosphohydrolase
LEEFHNKFTAGVNQTPQLLTPERSKIRYNMMREEVEEYLAGTKSRDLVNIANELADILYVTYGTVVAHGLQDKIEAIFTEIHRSNMTKDYHPVKAVKGEGYQPANIDQFFK